VLHLPDSDKDGETRGSKDKLDSRSGQDDEPAKRNEGGISDMIFFLLRSH